MEFLQALHQVRLDTFKRTIILSAWKKSGLIPFDPLVVINQIRPLSPSRPITPSQSTEPINHQSLTTPSNARMLETVACLLNGEEDISKETWNILQDKFMRGSLAIAFAAEAAYRDLARTTAAAQKRADARRDARQSLQTGGILYVQDGREAVDNTELVKLTEAQERLNRLEKRAANKVIKVQKAKDIAARKAQ